MTLPAQVSQSPFQVQSAPVEPRQSQRFQVVILGDGTAARVALRLAHQANAQIVWIRQTNAAPPETLVDSALFEHAMSVVGREIYRAAQGRRLLCPTPSAGEAKGASADIDQQALFQRVQRHMEEGTGLGGSPSDVSTNGRPDEGDLPRVDTWVGQATFTGPDRLRIGDRELRFCRAILALDRTLELPAVEGLQENGFLTPERLDQLEQLPQGLAVLGTGPAACRWAQIFARFGCEVHLLGSSPSILPEEDIEAAALIRAQLEHEQVHMHLDCRQLTVEKMGRRKAVVLRQGDRIGKILIDEILVCEPTRLELKGLRLESAGVLIDDRGAIVTDRLQTTNPRIFAVGETCGWRFSSAAAIEANAEVAVANALSLLPLPWLLRRFDAHTIARCVDTDPPIVRLGLDAHEISVRRDNLDLHRVEAIDDDSLLANPGPALLKIAVYRHTGRVAAVTAVGHHAPEWLGTLSLMMRRGIPFTALAEQQACGPALPALRWLAQQARPANRRPSWVRLDRWWQAWLHRWVKPFRR